MSSCTAALCAPVARPSSRRGASRRGRALVVRAGTTVKSGITVNTDPTAEEKQRASGWSTWACAASKFDWQYSNAETCYLIKGSVTVTPEGGESVTIRTGDIASFPAGMKCVWDVHEDLEKHFTSLLTRDTIRRARESTRAFS